MECLGAYVALLVFVAKVGKGDGDTGIEECQFAHTVGQDVVAVLVCGEDGAVGPELLACTGAVGIAYGLYCVERLTARVLLLIDFPITEYLGHHVC